MTLGDKIIKLRKEHGFSQEDLAQRIDVSRQSISKWELNESSPDADNLRKLSNLFKVSIDYILDDQQEEYIGHQNKGSNAGELIKRHWAKIGYYVAGIGLLASITMIPASSFMLKMLDDPFFSDISSILKVLRIVPIIMIIVGIGLIIYDRVNAKKYR